LQPDHELKSWPLFFQAFVDGLKKHDLRDIRDRTFEPGEIVRLLEWDPDGSGYTGRELWMVVTYVTDRIILVPSLAWRSTRVRQLLVWTF
jgi:hypothetical protein